MRTSWNQRKMHIMLCITLLVSLFPSAISASAAKGTTPMPLQKRLPSLDTCVKLVLKNGQKNQFNQLNTKTPSPKVAIRALKNVQNTTTSADALTACTEKSSQIAFAGAVAVPAAYEMAAYLFVLFSSYCVANKDCRDVTQTIYEKVEHMVGKMIAVGSIKWSNAVKKTAETLQYFKKLWTAFQKENFDKSKIDAIITAERKKANKIPLKTSAMSTNARAGELPIFSFEVGDLKNYYISEVATGHIAKRCLSELILKQREKGYMKLVHASMQKSKPHQETATLVVLQIVGGLSCRVSNNLEKKIKYNEAYKDRTRVPKKKLTEDDIYLNKEVLTEVMLKQADNPTMKVYLFLIVSDTEITNITPQKDQKDLVPFKGFIRHAHFRNGTDRMKMEIEHMRENGCFSLQIYPSYREEDKKYGNCKNRHRHFPENQLQFTADFLEKYTFQRKPYSLKPTLKKK